MDQQAGSRRLDKLIRGLANGDINHLSWTDSAKACLRASITLHSLAGQELLRQPSPSYDWRLFDSFIVAELSGGSRETFIALFFDTHYRLRCCAWAVSIARLCTLGWWLLEHWPIKQRLWWSHTIIRRVFLHRVILILRLLRNYRKH